MPPTEFPLETDQPQIEVTLPVGSWELELVVVDSGGLESQPDRVTVASEVIPRPPVADAGTDVRATPFDDEETMTVNLDASGSRPFSGREIARYRWRVVSTSPDG